MRKKKINYINMIFHFIYSLIILLLLGLIFDAFFQAIPLTGAFAPAIKLLKLAAPGISDIAKLFLDMIYAGIYAILKEK